MAAASIGPVAVAIDASDDIFQHYKSGTLSGTCGTKLDHGVTVVGYTPTTWIVKNSWGTTWGVKGYVEMARNVPPLGQCGIGKFAHNLPLLAIIGVLLTDRVCIPTASLAQFPVSVPAGTLPLPIGPRTDNKTRPTLPCNCELSCVKQCKSFGMQCCDGTGGNCNCAPASSCPKCAAKVEPYGRCITSCAPNSIDAGCVSTAGLPGSICAPRCNGAPWGTDQSCPPVPDLPGVTAIGTCDYCFGANSSTDSPTACALVCTATAVAPPFARDGCLPGQTCKPMCYNYPQCQEKDPCEAGKAHMATLPCAKAKLGTFETACGFCTYDV